MADAIKPYAYIEDLTKSLTQVPQDSILSRTLFRAPDSEVVMFGFAPGQRLSEHTASRPAVIHILQGEAELTLGEDRYQAGPGAWAHMDPGLPHSLQARTHVVMLLTLIGPD